MPVADVLRVLTEIDVFPCCEADLEPSMLSVWAIVRSTSVVPWKCSLMHVLLFGGTCAHKILMYIYILFMISTTGATKR